MNISLTIKTEADVLNAAARAAGIALAAQCSPVDQARVHLAVLAAASKALASGLPLNVETSGRDLVVSAGEQDWHFPIGSEPVSAEAVDPATLFGALTESTSGILQQMHSLQTEIDETNRGVLALYAELDDRAEKLKRADELKSRFLSYASHELRTPLNGIVGLIRLLSKNPVRHDIEEQKQLAFILRSAEEMREMVNDLLDLAKVEAGKVTVQRSEFGLDFVFGALRGIFRPLLQTEDVVLAFDDTSAVPSIYSDEAKVSQILRNLISNSLKFTEHGEVRVWAELAGDTVRISVRDTGIGIAPEHMDRIFEEYAQIEHPLQRRVRGTGLGLPLCRKMSHLLGGRIEVQSDVGRGSTFTLVLPSHLGASVSALPEDKLIPEPSRSRPRVLLIDHAEIDRYLLGQLIRGSCSCELLQADNGQKGLELAQHEQPNLIFLDLSVPLLDWSVILTELRANSRTAHIPVVAVSGRMVTEEEQSVLDRSVLAILSKEKLSDARSLTIDFGPPVSVEVCKN